MKKKLISVMSTTLALLMIATSLISCKTPPVSNEDPTKDSAESNPIAEATTTYNEKTSEETTSSDDTTAPENEYTDYTEKHAELITTTNALANGVQGRFANSSWSAYIVENQNMSFEYRLNKKRDQYFSYLNNAEGNPYFEDSFDVYVKMDDGKTYYAVDSTEDAIVNIFKFGYYYNEVRVEHQNFVTTEGRERIAIPSLRLARVFHTYSDKLHTVAQIAATEETQGIASIGFELQIPTKNVAKLIVADANGTHGTIDGVDWSTATYVAFDIKNAGILGYILPVGYSDKLTVAIDGKNYVITQERSPENNTILPGEGDPENSEGMIGNGNDFYIGQRIYTDTSHDFDAFLTEAYIERNPLTQKNIKVSTAYSSYGEFDGYDALRGSYMFSIDSPHDGNNQYGVCQNRHFYLNFTLKSDSYKRVIYTATASTSGSLECAALLDDNLMMIPVPIENGKNFIGDGDDNLFSLLDTGYGESILPVIAQPDRIQEYTLVNIYQNWGNFPLKQLSFIQFHSPYYHLSTGLTETNCLVPWKFTISAEIKNMLPDHRGMSAPMWPGTYQHTQSGTHAFLSYSDASNKAQQSNLYDQKIHSYGPTYADVEMNHISTDGKIRITYHHIEMPQLDENRGYYTIEYEFLEDVEIKNFKQNATIYGMGSLEWPTLYEMFSYLDENNEPQIRNFKDVNNGSIIVLGDKSPYLTLMKLNSINYGNTSIVVKDYEVVIGGKAADVRLACRTSHNGNGAALTLDLGNVIFKKGDSIKINAILTPWGSEETDYSGELYPADQNVRDLRENSCLNPITATAGDGTEVVEHPFIPMLKALDGENAEFTISGGKENTISIPHRNKGYNVAIRVYGFDRLSVPIVYELVDGEWIPYELSSANNRDSAEYGAYYDGYCVYYDEDGTYSYSFVINMDEAKPRTFKIGLDEDFEKFGRIEGNPELLEKKSPFKHYLNSGDFAASLYKGWFGRVTLGTDEGVNFVSLYPHPSYAESQMERAFQNNDGVETGQYVIIKYRFPLTNPAEITSPLEFFTSTVNERAADPDSFAFYDEIVRDGQWHVIVVDVTKFGKSSIVAEEDGTYKLKHVRLDPINGTNTMDYHIDIAYFGIHNNLDEIIEFNADEDEIHLVEGFGNVTVIPTK